MKEAHLCPHCGKMACHECMKKWLSQNFACPYCRSTLLQTQLVKANFISDISAEIEKLKQIERSRRSIADGSSSRFGEDDDDDEDDEENDMCSVHKLPLIYFCETCNDACCSDCCVLAESPHHGHELSRLNAVYDKHLERVTDAIEELETRKTELMLAMEGIDENIALIKSVKESHTRDIQIHLQRMQERLENEVNKKLIGLHSQKATLIDSINECTATVDTLQREIRRQSQSALVSKSSDMIHAALEVCRSMANDHFVNIPPTPPDMVNELIPPYDHAEFNIPNYSSWIEKAAKAQEEQRDSGTAGSGQAQQRTGEEEPVLLSPPLRVGPLKWRLKVYPTGTGVSRNVFVSVFVELVNGLDEPLPFEYRVEMVNVRDESRNVAREFSSTFSRSESWGYNRFFRIADMHSGGFIDTDNEDTVKFRFFVRSPTYYDKCIEQRLHMARMQSTIDILRQRIASMSKERVVEAYVVSDEPTQQQQKEQGEKLEMLPKVESSGETLEEEERTASVEERENTEATVLHSGTESCDEADHSDSAGSSLVHVRLRITGKRANIGGEITNKGNDDDQGETVSRSSSGTQSTTE